MFSFRRSVARQYQGPNIRSRGVGCPYSTRPLIESGGRAAPRHMLAAADLFEEGFADRGPKWWPASSDGRNSSERTARTWTEQNAAGPDDCLHLDAFERSSRSAEVHFGPRVSYAAAAETMKAGLARPSIQ